MVLRLLDLGRGGVDGAVSSGGGDGDWRHGFWVWWCLETYEGEEVSGFVAPVGGGGGREMEDGGEERG